MEHRKRQERDHLNRSCPFMPAPLAARGLSMESEHIACAEVWRDFNDAEPEPDDAEEVSAEDVRRRMVGHLPVLLRRLFPKGLFKGSDFVVGDIHGNKGDSLKVALTAEKAGLWIDHAAPDSKGDIIALWAAAHGRSLKAEFRQILRDIIGWLDSQSWRGTGSGAARQDVGEHVGRWDYCDARGEIIATVDRYDLPDGSKQFRPFNVATRREEHPTPRPLYNILGLITADEIVVVEGEKTAQALIERGICATTLMGGANAPVEKTDMSLLSGKRLLIWPDKDAPGAKYADNVAGAALAAGATSVAILVPPADKPEKWDAADAVAEGIDVATFITSTPRREVRHRRALVLSEWSAQRFEGPAPEARYLVSGTFPMAAPCLLAAPGDTGKGMLSLDLALKVASPPPANALSAPAAFGGTVMEFGTAVVLTAEDDHAEVHRRLQRLDPDGYRAKCGDRLIIVPLPSAGGAMPFIVGGRNQPPELTDEFLRLQDQLRAIRDLKLLVIDPLSSFVQADITSDPAVGSFAMAQFAALATETGACTTLPHHLRKSPSEKPILTREQARDAIRGTTALVNGVRMAYAFWPASKEVEGATFAALQEKRAPNAVYIGAVVKSNGLADLTERTYLRVPSGLLVDITDRLRQADVPDDRLKELLVAAIAKAASEEHPFTKTGKSGLYANRHRLLALPLRKLGQKKFIRLVDKLLLEKKVVQARVTPAGPEHWLDVPGGSFAMGVAELARGAGEDA
jgi:hypothetical protein